MKLIHQVEDTEQRFRHRLINEHDDPAAETLPHAPWTGYTGMALNYTKKGTFVAVPAYGRDYTSKAKLLADWQAGKDFRAEPSGQYFSIRDREALKAAGVKALNIRYKGMREIAVIQL